MFLIVEILGKQYKIFKNLKIKIDKINLKNNSILILNNILLLSCDKFFIINKFFLNKIIIKSRILNNFKRKKIKILKYKRRKGYKKNIGFRKYSCEILIEDIYLDYFFSIYYGSKKIRRFF